MESALNSNALHTNVTATKNTVFLDNTYFQKDGHHRFS